MAARDTHIRVLGAFELVHDGHVVPVNGAVGQAILTALACRPNTKLLPAQLISMVWGHADAVNTDTLYHHVTKLRRALAPVGLDIVGHRPGYRLPVTAGQVDVARFDELLRTARALAGTDPDQASERLRAAVGLWRAPYAVDSVTLPGIRRLATSWETRRWDAEEDLAEIELRRGRPDQILDRLHTLATAHPDRPRLTAVLARALHASGRTDQATTVLDNADHTASRARQAVHPALIEARQALSTPGPPRTRQDRIAASVSTVVPFQLPADTVHFTGRTEQLARLLELCPNPDRPDGPGGPATVLICAVEGMAGIGKTALAVHAAHQLADRFVDGVLFTNLHGFTTDTKPTAPDQAMNHLLRGLGVSGPQIPPDLEDRVGLYRSLLAHRRVLIVLDNAAHETQLAPLLPATPGCLAIVTSRRHLAGLDDATHLTLPSLDPTEAARLFCRVAGDRAAPAHQHTIDRIVAQCGRLPLAIRITAARLRQAPAANPTTVCAELADALGTGQGLDWLSDGHRAVGAALAMSYRHLTPNQQHAFRLTGLHPGPSIEPYGLAALANTTIDNARQLLEDLYAASLLDQPNHRRYSLHNLIAAYAATLATDLPEPDRHTALSRLYNHYSATSSQAINLTYPWDIDQRPHPPATRTPTPTLVNWKQAQAWLDTEFDNLLATAHHAASQQRTDHTLHQSATLHQHLRARGHYIQAAFLHQKALAIARQTSNHPAEQHELIRLGDIHHRQGQLGQAADCFERALDLARQTSNHNVEQNALCGLGDIHRVQGRLGPAVASLEQALDIARKTGNHSAEHDALINLSGVHRMQGRFGPAADCLERALDLARKTGYRNIEEYALTGLGHIHFLRGQYMPAADCFEQAAASTRRTGYRGAAHDALNALGIANRLLGRYGRAAESFDKALASARQSGDRNGQFEAHHGLGRVQHTNSKHHDALNHYQTALHLAVDLDQPADRARAHDGLAHTHLALGDSHQARRHWQAALHLLASVGTDHTIEPDVTTATICAHLHGLTNDRVSDNDRPRSDIADPAEHA